MSGTVDVCLPRQNLSLSAEAESLMAFQCPATILGEMRRWHSRGLNRPCAHALTTRTAPEKTGQGPGGLVVFYRAVASMTLPVTWPRSRRTTGRCLVPGHAGRQGLQSRLIRFVLTMWSAAQRAVVTSVRSSDTHCSLPREIPVRLHLVVVIRASAASALPDPDSAIRATGVAVQQWGKPRV